MVVSTLFPPTPLYTADSLRQRSDVDLEQLLLEDQEERLRTERVKDGLTTMVGAVMQKQQCWEKTACTVGTYLNTVQGKEVIFV